MMNQARSRAIGRTKYLVFLPLTALLMLFGNLMSCGMSGDKSSSKTEESVVEAPEAEAAAPVAEEKVVLTIVDEMPKFPGGDEELLKFLRNNVKYPVSAQENGKEGRVSIEFVITEDGTVSDAKVIKGVEASLDAEALRVVNLMPLWTPGKQDGKAVAVRYTVPINFQFNLQ